MDYMVATVLYIGGIAGAVAAIIGLLTKLLAPLFKMAQNYEEDKAMQLYCQKITLRMAVFNAAFSDADRIEAGELYIKMGGNGYTKAYIKKLRESMEHKIEEKVNGEHE